LKRSDEGEEEEEEVRVLGMEVGLYLKYFHSSNKSHRKQQADLSVLLDEVKKDQHEEGEQTADTASDQSQQQQQQHTNDETDIVDGESLKEHTDELVVLEFGTDYRKTNKKKKKKGKGNSGNSDRVDAKQIRIQQFRYSNVGLAWKV